MASLTKQKKHLSFTALRKMFSSHINSLPDPREQGKCQFTLHDMVMSAFSSMYFQHASFAENQRQMEIKKHKNNLRTLFNVNQVAKESQHKDVLDELPSTSFSPVFKDIFSRLRRHKHLEEFSILPNTLLCVIDGTQYHSSQHIHCEQCLHKEHTKGKLTYSHAVLQGAIMHPDKKQVLPVMPEAISNTDGEEKQDCETNAAKRFIANLKSTYPRQGFMICGDGLMSHQPMIEEVLKATMHYLFVAKPGDHKIMYEWLNDFDKLPLYEYTDDKGSIHSYRYKNGAPLNGNDKTVEVNFFDYSITNDQGKQTFYNSWVTDMTLSLHNIKEMARAGKCRWKIENECFNTLKNQGYEIKHNYGHGKKNLSYNMYLLTLIAFYFHQVFELTDGTYQACRKKFVSKLSMWEKFRGAMHFFVMGSWEMMMDFLLNEDDYEVPLTKKV